MNLFAPWVILPLRALMTSTLSNSSGFQIQSEQIRGFESNLGFPHTGIWVIAGILTNTLQRILKEKFEEPNDVGRI